MDSTYGTPYVETEALLAVQSDAPAELARLIEEMSPSERRKLASAADMLSDALWDREGKPAGWGDVEAERHFRLRVIRARRTTVAR